MTFKVKGRGRDVTWCVWQVLADKPRKKSPINTKIAIERLPTPRAIMRTIFKVKRSRSPGKLIPKLPTQRVKFKCETVQQMSPRSGEYRVRDTPCYRRPEWIGTWNSFYSGPWPTQAPPRSATADSTAVHLRLAIPLSIDTLLPGKSLTRQCDFQSLRRIAQSRRLTGSRTTPASWQTPIHQTDIKPNTQLHDRHSIERKLTPATRSPLTEIYFCTLWTCDLIDLWLNFWPIKWLARTHDMDYPCGKYLEIVVSAGLVLSYGKAHRHITYTHTHTDTSTYGTARHYIPA